MASPTRIHLRRWREGDLAPFAEMNADPVVMRWFPKCLTPDESKAAFERMASDLEKRGWGLWAVDVDGDFAGLCGLSVPGFASIFTPCVEIGWRFRREFWGRSIAYTAARAAETFAFGTLKLPELASFTATQNQRSRRLMERLGFARSASEDFMHPLLPENSPLRLHVLYRKRLGALATTEQESQDRLHVTLTP